MRNVKKSEQYVLNSSRILAMHYYQIEADHFNEVDEEINPLKC